MLSGGSDNSLAGAEINCFRNSLLGVLNSNNAVDHAKGSSLERSGVCLAAHEYLYSLGAHRSDSCVLPCVGDVSAVERRISCAESLACDKVDLGGGSGSVNLCQLSCVAHGACELCAAGRLEALGVNNCNYRDREYVSELNESCDLCAVSGCELSCLVGGDNCNGAPVNACESCVCGGAELSAELYDGALVSERGNEVGGLQVSCDCCVVVCEIIVACEGDIVCRKDSRQLLSLCNSVRVVLCNDIGNAGLSCVCSLACALELAVGCVERSVKEQLSLLG